MPFPSFDVYLTAKLYLELKIPKAIIRNELITNKLQDLKGEIGQSGAKFSN